MLILMSYLLITFLYNNLQCPTFAVGFTLDLIHRYSSPSPFYNSTMTLQERSRLLAHHSSLRYNHLKRLQNTDKNDYDTNQLIQNYGDYLLEVSIGVPPVDLFVIVDTGSDLIWVQCKPCNHCYPQNAPLFDPKKSSTYRTVPCNSPICVNAPETECSYSSDECHYRYSYGDGSTMTSGIMATDRFTLANSSILFGCGFTQRGEDYDENESGIVGLSGGPLSLISQLGSTIDNTFSYCLTPSNLNVSSKLRLGGTDVETKQGNVLPASAKVTVPLSNDYYPDFYAVSLKYISIGHRRFRVEKDIIIDNGSTLTYLEPRVYSRIEKAVKKVIVVKPMVNTPEVGFKLCYDVKLGFRGLDNNIVMHLSEGNIVLNATNIMIDFGDYFCLGVVPMEKDDNGIMILGNVAQVNFEVEFDLVHKTVSFTPANCSVG